MLSFEDYVAKFAKTPKPDAIAAPSPLPRPVATVWPQQVVGAEAEPVPAGQVGQGKGMTYALILLVALGALGGFFLYNKGRAIRS